jgi:hypothetical protein
MAVTTPGIIDPLRRDPADAPVLGPDGKPLPDPTATGDPVTKKPPVTPGGALPPYALPPDGGPPAPPPITPPGTQEGITAPGPDGTFGSPSGNTDTAWTPTSGIVDKIRGITPQNVDATGTTVTDVAATPDATTTNYDATGYDAKQGTAATADTTLSGALDKVLANDSPVLQRARAQADQQANARGLINSSMATQAGTAATIDAALPIAQGDVQAQQFNAQQQNVMTISNTEQANAALAFHAQATNQALEFSAAAKNSASQFNSAEAQQKALFAAQQWDAAAQFSAAAKNAAASQNASAYNDAMQRYVDAKNAATAAQNDAENLSRRDTAQITAQEQMTNTQAAANIAAAGEHAAGMVEAAHISADAQQAMQKAGLTQNQSQFLTSQGNTEFNNFQGGLLAIQTSQLEPDAKQNAIHNYMSVWSAKGDLPFTIDMSQFPAAGGPPAGP